MPATTPKYALPYPVPADPADVPADMAALANRLEIVLPMSAVFQRISHTQIVAAVTPAAVAEASSTVIVTAPAVNVIAGDVLLAEFFSPQVGTGLVAGNLVVGHLFDGATSLGNLFAVANPGSAAAGVPVLARQYVSPAAGSHTFSIRARSTGQTGIIYAGAGGTGAYTPAWLDLWKLTP